MENKFIDFVREVYRQIILSFGGEITYRLAAAKRSAESGAKNLIKG